MDKQSIAHSMNLKNERFGIVIGTEWGKNRCVVSSGKREAKGWRNSSKPNPFDRSIVHN